METTNQQLIKKIESAPLKTIDKGNILISRYVLGEGTYASVNLGYVKNINKVVAVKMVDKKTISIKIEQLFHDFEQGKKNAIENFLKNQKQEINILRKVDHENIVKCYNISETQNTIYIVFGYEPSGYVDFKGIPIRCDLRSVILSNQIKPFEKVQYLLDIAEGLHHLYSENVFHRDLKPENVIIQNKRAKITDFGQSKSMTVDKDLQKQQTLFVGSPYYRAIQILENKNYSIKCDIWSFGVLIYVLFFNTIPWGPCPNQQVLMNKARDPIEFNANIKVPQKVKVLIENTIKVEEEERWNALQVLEWCRIIYDEEKEKLQQKKMEIE